MDDEGFQQSHSEDSSDSKEIVFSIRQRLPHPNPIVPAIADMQLECIPLYKRCNDEECVYLKHRKKEQAHSFKYHFNGYFTNEMKFESNKLENMESEMIFNSNFQSGNLFSAYKNDREYDLILQEDINSNGYSQWFYFSVNNNAKQQMRINIINLSRDYLPLKQGLGIYLYENHQWKPFKQQLIMTRSNYTKLIYGKPPRRLYKISFTISHSMELFKLALSIPYTLYDLERFLSSRKHETLTYTVSNNPIKILSFGSLKKDVIIVFARQHPGETVSSHVCEGLMIKLSEDNLLTQQYNIIVFPMLNPDGVEQGNFRCDVSGADMNRSWQKPNKMQFHLIHIKAFIQDILNSGRDIKCFIDLHGHSKLLGCFSYACRGPFDSVECRVFQSIMQSVCKYFNFNRCTYSLEPNKLKTARAAVYKMTSRFKVQFRNIFTLETSFFGYEQFGIPTQYTLQDLHRIGENLYQALSIYFTDSVAVQKTTNQLEKYRSQFNQEDIRKNKEQLDSDSDPEEGYISSTDLKKTLIKKKINQRILNNTNYGDAQKRQIQTTVDQIMNRSSNIFKLPKRSIQLESRKQSVYHQSSLKTSQQQIYDSNPYQGPRIMATQPQCQQNTSVTHQENRSVEIFKDLPIKHFRRLPNQGVPSYLYQTGAKTIKTNNARITQQNYFNASTHSEQQQEQDYLKKSPNQIVRSISTREDNHFIFQANRKVRRKNTQVIQ